MSGNSAGGYGGAVYSTNSDPVNLNNCIFWGNTATSGGDELYASRGGSPSTMNVNNCCLEPTSWSTFGGAAININTETVYADPAFLDADGADDTVGTLDDDLRVQGSSSCIDAGDNSYVPSGVTTDLDGNPRIVDGNNDGNAVVDIGAYEHQP